MMFIARVSTDKRREFLQTMISLQAQKKKEKGIRDSGVYSDVHDEKRFSVIDEWETEKDLSTYLDGEGYRVLLGALQVLCTDVEVNCGPVRRMNADGEGHCKKM